MDAFFELILDFLFDFLGSLGSSRRIPKIIRLFFALIPVLFFIFLSIAMIIVGIGFGFSEKELISFIGYWLLTLVVILFTLYFIFRFLRKLGAR